MSMSALLYQVSTFSKNRSWNKKEYLQSLLDQGTFHLPLRDSLSCADKKRSLWLFEKRVVTRLLSYLGVYILVIRFRILMMSNAVVLFWTKPIWHHVCKTNPCTYFIRFWLYPLYVLYVFYFELLRVLSTLTFVRDTILQLSSWPWLILQQGHDVVSFSCTFQCQWRSSGPGTGSEATGTLDLHFVQGGSQTADSGPSYDQETGFSFFP